MINIKTIGFKALSEIKVGDFIERDGQSGRVTDIVRKDISHKEVFFKFVNDTCASFRVCINPINDKFYK